MSDNQLTVIAPSAVSTIVANGGGDILSEIAAKVAAFRPDISTTTGRDKMRSLAADIAKSKMELIRLGKGLTVEWRDKTKAVNAECNLIEERMDELRDRVRGPLTEFENREKNRVAEHQAALAAVDCWPVLDTPMNATQLAEHIAGIEASDMNRRDWQEFAIPAQNAIDHAMTKLRTMLAALVKQEAEAAELESFRAAAAQKQAEEIERQRIEREAQIAKDAAEAARVEAERVAAEQAAKVEADRVASEKAAADAIAAATERAAQAERDRVAEGARAEAARLKAAEDAKEALAKAERDREAAEKAAKAAAEKAEADRLQAIKDAAMAQAKALADAEAARVAGVKRIAAEEEARAADRAHRGKIMGAAKDALMAHAGLTEEQAKATVKAIAGGLVPSVGVKF